MPQVIHVDVDTGYDIEHCTMTSLGGHIPAGHLYRLVSPHDDVTLSFQCGPLREVGPNGITSEHLLHVLIHRTRELNAMFPCEENGEAIEAMVKALAAFDRRTASRKARGVEGKSEV